MNVKQIASLIVLAAAAVVSRPTQHFRRGDVSLSEWHSHNLESYWTFRNRFRALKCADQRGTPFYESCCYPLEAGQSLSSRPDNCTPKDATCDIVATPPPNAQNCPVDDGHSQDPAAPEPSQADNNDEDLPWCDEVGDDDDDNNNYDDGDNQDYNSPAPTTPEPPVDTPAPQPDNSGDDNNGDNNQDHSGSGDSQVYTGGEATWYEQEGLAGACGEFHSDDELIAAMDYRKYGNIDSVSSLCGKRVHIKNLRNGNTVEVVIRDVCPSCKNAESIDLSLAAFAVLDDMDVGVLPIEWYFMN